MPCLLQNALKGQKLLAQGNTLGGVDASLSPCKGKSFIKEKSVLLIFWGTLFSYMIFFLTILLPSGNLRHQVPSYP